jgi:hypothetical protein
MHPHLLPTYALAALSLLHASPAPAAVQTSNALANLSLEQLSDIVVSSVARPSRRAPGAPKHAGPPQAALQGYHEFEPPLVWRVWPELNRELAGPSLPGAASSLSGTRAADSLTKRALVRGKLSRI